jgi:hypothetical protein
MHIFPLKCVLPSTGAVVLSIKREGATRMSSPEQLEVADTLEDVPHNVSVSAVYAQNQLLTRQCDRTDLTFMLQNKAKSYLNVAAQHSAQRSATSVCWPTTADTTCAHADTGSNWSTAPHNTSILTPRSYPLFLLYCSHKALVRH